MNKITQQQTYARTLVTDLGAPEALTLNRREVLLDWLREFLRRSAAKGYESDMQDVDNLIALDQYLRLNRLPVTLRELLVA